MKLTIFIHGTMLATILKCSQESNCGFIVLAKTQNTITLDFNNLFAVFELGQIVGIEAVKAVAPTDLF